jgi:hypothetical protein
VASADLTAILSVVGLSSPFPDALDARLMESRLSFICPLYNRFAAALVLKPGIRLAFHPAVSAWK